MKIYCKNKHWEINKNYNLDKILYLLIDRPDYVISNNCFIWKNKKGQDHREYDLPAYVYKNCHFEWCKNNKCHRENNKPARILIDGEKQYWLNSNFIRSENS